MRLDDEHPETARSIDAHAGKLVADLPRQVRVALEAVNALDQTLTQLNFCRHEVISETVMGRDARDMTGVAGGALRHVALIVEKISSDEAPAAPEVEIREH